MSTDDSHFVFYNRPALNVQFRYVHCVLFLLLSLLILLQFHLLEETSVLHSPSSLMQHTDNFLLFLLLWNHLWTECCIFSPSKIPQQAMTLHLILWKYITVEIIFQLNKPPCKEMWCSVSFCAWRMWRSSITKLELSPWWVCRSLFL